MVPLSQFANCIMVLIPRETNILQYLDKESVLDDKLDDKLESGYDKLDEESGDDKLDS